MSEENVEPAYSAGWNTNNVKVITPNAHFSGKHYLSINSNDGLVKPKLEIAGPAGDEFLWDIEDEENVLDSCRAKMKPANLEINPRKEEGKTMLNRRFPLKSSTPNSK